MLTGQDPLQLRCKHCGTEFNARRPTSASSVVPSRCPDCGRVTQMTLELVSLRPRLGPIDTGWIDIATDLQVLLGEDPAPGGAQTGPEAASAQALTSTVSGVLGGPDSGRSATGTQEYPLVRSSTSQLWGGQAWSPAEIEVSGDSAPIRPSLRSETSGRVSTSNYMERPTSPPLPAHRPTPLMGSAALVSAALVEAARSSLPEEGPARPQPEMVSDSLSLAPVHVERQWGPLVMLLSAALAAGTAFSIHRARQHHAIPARVAAPAPPPPPAAPAPAPAEPRAALAVAPAPALPAYSPEVRAGLVKARSLMCRSRIKTERVLTLALKDGETAELHTALGGCALAGRRLAEARAHFEAALRLAPDDLTALRGLGHTYRLSGDKRKALELYRRYLKYPGAPRSRTVRKHIAALEAALARGK